MYSCESNNDVNSINSILSENLLQLLNAATAAAATTAVTTPTAGPRSPLATSSSVTSSSSSSSSPLHYFMQKLTLGDEQTNQMMMATNLSQLTKQTQQQKPGFPLKPNVSTADPIVQSELGLPNRNAISPTGFLFYINQLKWRSYVFLMKSQIIEVVYLVFFL